MTQKEIASLIEFYESELTQLEFRKMVVEKTLKRLQVQLERNLLHEESQPKLEKPATTQHKTSFASADPPTRPPKPHPSPWDDDDILDDDLDDEKGNENA